MPSPDLKTMRVFTPKETHYEVVNIYSLLSFILFFNKIMYSCLFTTNATIIIYIFYKCWVQTFVSLWHLAVTYSIDLGFFFNPKWVTKKQGTLVGSICCIIFTSQGFLIRTASHEPKASNDDVTSIYRSSKYQYEYIKYIFWK